MRIIEVTGAEGSRRRVDLDDPNNQPAQDGDRLSIPILLCVTAGCRDDCDDGNPYAITDEMRQTVEDSRNQMIGPLNNAWPGRLQIAKQFELRGKLYREFS